MLAVAVVLTEVAGCGGGGNSGGGTTQLTTPTLIFATILPKTYGDPPFTISATSASSGAVTYAVKSGPATVSGNTVTLTGAGTIALSASQAASVDYAAATATTSVAVAGDKEWTCVGGCVNGTSSGLYGTLGVAGSGVPSGRAYAVSWADSAPNLWLFGGTSSVGYTLNDLWEYSPSTSDWTWVSGNTLLFCSNWENGVFGCPAVGSALGTFDSGNTPGARTGSAGWTDNVGDFWLFGGSIIYGYDANPISGGNLNDLWKFSISKGEWAWMGGSTTLSTSKTTGNYGEKGVPSPNNWPPIRSLAVSWTDKNGNLWLFGGTDFNDLWEYSPTSNEWTWVSGSSIQSAFGIYGTQGHATSGTTPGARGGAVSWTDSNGNLWLSGGNGLDSNGAEGYLNDLWEFSTGSNQWAWMGGSNTVNAAGVYGILGTAASSNVPGARMYSVGWTDNLGDLWLFGGTDASEEFNDLWEFNPSTTEWTWMSGSSTGNAISVYGTPGTPAPGNVPGARYGAVGIPIDPNGNIWLFGGDAANGYPGDLWSYQP